jgi:hypothetical protein
MQARQPGRVPPICLNAIARTVWDQRRSDRDALVHAPTTDVECYAARPCLLTKPKFRAGAAELAQQTGQRYRRVRDSTVFPHLTTAALGQLPQRSLPCE